MHQYKTSSFTESACFYNHKLHFSSCTTKGSDESAGTQFTKWNSPARELKDNDWSTFITQTSSIMDLSYTGVSSASALKKILARHCRNQQRLQRVMLGEQLKEYCTRVASQKFLKFTTSK